VKKQMAHHSGDLKGMQIDHSANELAAG